MYSKFSSKDLYEVSLKTTDNIEINNQSYEKDEVVLFFNKIQIANISPDVATFDAAGGKNNFTWITWENVKGVDFVFEDGVLSFPAFNLLTQSKAINSENNIITIPRREFLVTSAAGIATLLDAPASGRSIFAYKLSGDIITEKLTIVSINAKAVNLGSGNATTSILIDYYFADDHIMYYNIGGENFKGFFKLTSKINFVDEKDGIRTTMLLVLPKVKILSSIGLTMGIRANPIVSTFRIRAFPDDDGKTLARFIYLNQDIEG